MLNHSLEILYKMLLTFILILVLILFAIGIGDYLWSRHTLAGKTKMSRQDLKGGVKRKRGLT